MTLPIDRAEPVLVVGAGIAGLTAALAFAKAGFTVEILERASRLEEVGAGIQLSPNALRVLTRLGLAGDLRGTAVSAGTVTLRAARDGRPIAEVPIRSSDGTAYLSLHRADLQAALLAGVARQPGIEFRLGVECVGLEREDADTVLLLRDATGRNAPERRRGRIVIAADGVGSAVARALGHGAAAPSGDIAWRMTIRDAEPGANEAGGIEAWLGSGRHAVAYPVRAGLDLNIVLIGPRGDAGSDLDASAGKAALLARFALWDPRLKRMIAAAGPATAWPLSICDRARSPGDPPGLLLIGDAAHAMLPYAAQGAAMAIEDGFVAASAFAAASTREEAVARFERERMPRIARVRRRVALHRLVYHLPPALAPARDLVLKVRPKAALARELAWLYDWNPPALAEASALPL